MKEWVDASSQEQEYEESVPGLSDMEMSIHILFQSVCWIKKDEKNQPSFEKEQRGVEEENQLALYLMQSVYI